MSECDDLIEYRSSGESDFDPTLYAFPTEPLALRKFRGHGMTLRDYFAAAALTGVMADGVARSWGGIAKVSYEAADALLAERNRRETE